MIPEPVVWSILGLLVALQGAYYALSLPTLRKARADCEENAGELASLRAEVAHLGQRVDLLAGLSLEAFEATVARSDWHSTMLARILLEETRLVPVEDVLLNEGQLARRMKVRAQELEIAGTFGPHSRSSLKKLIQGEGDHMTMKRLYEAAAIDARFSGLAEDLANRLDAQ